jgi:hypothetical protein
MRGTAERSGVQRRAEASEGSGPRGCEGGETAANAISAAEAYALTTTIFTKINGS